MTLLADVTAVSQRVGATPSRLAKVRELAHCLRLLEADEIPIAIAFLSGETRQGKLGVSYATLQTADSSTPSAAHPVLTLHEVDAAFEELAGTRGKGAAAKRSQLLAAVFGRATAQEQDFLVRLIVGELRQGALKALMLDAIAQAAELPVNVVRKAAMSAGGIGDVATAALTEGAGGLTRFSIRLMQPVLPMLSQSAPDTQAALRQLATAAFEWKLDGARVQVHKAGDEVRVYTRIDCLMRGDDALVDRPAAERFRALEESLPPAAIIPRIVTADPDEAARFLEAALKHGHEGVMAKALDAPYEAGRRGASWLKIKRANTLDLVVLAAEWGHGRRSGWLSNLHLGARDPAGGFVMLGKTFKGMTDEMLEWQTAEFLKLETHRDGWTVYLEPRTVVEVAFNEVQASSQYSGGLALRFARVKAYRPDKRADDADTIDAVRAIYTAQVHAGGPL